MGHSASARSMGATIVSPFAAPPEPGAATEVAPGILWARMPLPLRLNHVNVFAFADDDGWTLLDTGFDNAETRGLWEALLRGPLAGRPVRRLIVSHFHLDHVGAAGWLVQRTGAQLLMTREEYLMSVLRSQGLAADVIAAEVAFFRPQGLPEPVLQRVGERDAFYRGAVGPLPAKVRILADGDAIRLAGRPWQVIVGGGHSFAQIMLRCLDEPLFYSADQVLGTITPNIPAFFGEPDGNPIADFLNSLRALRGQVDPGGLVLPGHKLPFSGIEQRIDQLIGHHERTLDRIEDLCRRDPVQVMTLAENLFQGNLGASGMSLAAAEVLAHLMALEHAGRVRGELRADGQIFWLAE